jgi:ADP-heptose:LPS heptosyltransferase
MKILVLIGSQSVGDTLCAIPTIKYLSEIYDQNIYVYTYQKELLKNYPYIILTDNQTPDDGDLFIETFRPDKFLHTRTDIRQIHSISAGFQLLPEEMKIEFFPDEYEEISNLPENYIVMHPVKSWPSRSWEKERWQELVNEINKINIPIVLIGKDAVEHGNYKIQKPVYDIDVKNGLNLINKINIHQTWHILNKSSMVITMDSGILHLAGTTDTHIIQLGSSIDPRLRSPYRKGYQNYKYSYILGDCKLFCASDMKYCIKYNSKYNIMPPVAFCLDNPETVGQDIDPDPNIYKCHPTVDKVYNEIVKNYKFPNKGRILL